MPAVPAGPVHPLQHIVPPKQRRFLLRARRANQHEHGARGYAPNAGLVHLVHPGVGLLKDDEHIMKDIFESSNKGVKSVLASRKGPFRKEQGRSRIMSRSAHITIRKRRKQTEISIRRAATEEELNALHAKLVAHSRTSPNCVVFFVERGKRKVLGTFKEIEILRLMELIRERISVHKGVIGILLVDDHFGGAMHNPKLHRGRFNRGHYVANTINHH